MSRRASVRQRHRPSRLRLPAAAALAVLTGVAAFPVNAGAGDLGPYERFEFSYTSQRPGTSTGFRYRVRLRIPPNAGQPPIVRQLRLEFTRGTRFDLRAITPCTASNERISQDGVDACAGTTRVATGRAGVYVGTETPLLLNATMFGTRTGVVVILTNADGAVIRTLRGTVRGRVLTVPVPAVPLGGGREAALVSFSLDIRRSGTTRRPWIRTPLTCTRAGWPVVYAPLFDPIGRVRLTDVTSCLPLSFTG